MRRSGKLFRKLFHASILLLFSLPHAAQDLVLKDGIFREKPLPDNTDIHAYSRDNISYKTGMQLLFDYYFLAPGSSEKKKFVYDPDSKKQSFSLHNYNSPEKNTISNIMMTITDDLFVFSFDSNYTQTVFRYDYLDASGRELTEETTGVIDNKKNLWMHPPRNDQFAMLELNPFPFQNLDESLKSWNWQLEVSDHWSDPRWKSWKEIITLRHKYERMKDESLDTKMGRLTCKVIEAVGTCEINNELFKTYLKSWYHSGFGFVRLEYTNINNTRLVMELTEVKTPKAENPDKKLFAEYGQNCCTNYFNETLKLYSDSSFEYSYSEKISQERHYGKWKADKDTLFLYDYIHPPLKEDTLSGAESIITLKDSVEIIFMDTDNKHKFRPLSTVNGRCLPMSMNDHYAVTPGIINFISVGAEKYFARNKSSNQFIIYLGSNFRYLKTNRVRNISRCLIKGRSILKVNCDGQLNGAYKLDKK
jgi:hypothetical protein